MRQWENHGNSHVAKHTLTPSLQLMPFYSFIKVKYKSNEKSPTLIFFFFFWPTFSSLVLHRNQNYTVCWDGIPKPTLHLPSPSSVVPVPESVGGWGGLHVKLCHWDSPGSHLRGKHGSRVDHRGCSHLQSKETVTALGGKETPGKLAQAGPCVNGGVRKDALDVRRCRMEMHKRWD